MPGLVKIGMTTRTPTERLKEANASVTWCIPDFKIEFAKKVSNPHQKEKTLHTLLEQYTTRVHSQREWFRVSIDQVMTFFDLIDGEMWDEAYATDQSQVSALKHSCKSSCLMSRSESDRVLQFIDERIVEGANKVLPKDEAWEEFKEWHQQNYPGTRIPSKKDMETHITKRFRKPDNRNGWLKVGIVLDLGNRIYQDD